MTGLPFMSASRAMFRCGDGSRKPKVDRLLAWLDGRRDFAGLADAIRADLFCEALDLGLRDAWRQFGKEQKRG